MEISRGAAGAAARYTVPMLLIYLFGCHDAHIANSLHSPNVNVQLHIFKAANV